MNAPCPHSFFLINELEIPHFVLRTGLFPICIFCRAFWVPSCDVRQESCIQGMFTRITFWSKRASTWIIVRYFDALVGHHGEHIFMSIHTNQIFKKIEAICFTEVCLLSLEIAAVFG